MRNGTFRKHDDYWTAGFITDNDGQPSPGEEATLTKKSGEVVNITLLGKVGEKTIAETGEHTTFWTFEEGHDDNEPF